MTFQDDSNPTNESRRSFIKGASILGAGAALSTAGAITALASDQETQSTIKQLKGRTALITGAARGIGLATAILLAKEGANIAILDICNPNAFPEIKSYELASAADMQNALREISQTGTKVQSFVADVRDQNAVSKAIQEINTSLGALDIVVANAGIAFSGSLEDHSLTLMNDILSVNVIGVANTIRCAIPSLKKSKFKGRIVALTSISGRMGTTDLSIYSASKWAVIGLIKSLSLELGPEQITVNAVAPTAVNTLMFQGKLGAQNYDLLNEMVKQYHALPVGILEPEEIAKAILFLVSDAAVNISGITLDVNAGWSGKLTG